MTKPPPIIFVNARDSHEGKEGSAILCGVCKDRDGKRGAAVIFDTPEAFFTQRDHRALHDLGQWALKASHWLSMVSRRAGYEKRNEKRKKERRLDREKRMRPDLEALSDGLTKSTDEE